MLKLTGHPFFDVGVATITAFSGKDNYRKVTEGDLERIAAYMKRQYVVDPLKSFLTVVFPNSGFSNPAFNKNPEKRLDYAELVLQAYKKKHGKKENESQRCVFTGEPAIDFSLSDKTLPGRVYRQHLPLVTGEGIINFHPNGISGLPISGLALLCIHAFPLGCAKCGGKLLAVHSDNFKVMLHFARDFLIKNKDNLTSAQAMGSKKMPEYNKTHKTQLIYSLENVLKELEEYEEIYNYSVIAYHFSNSGQGPDLNIYQIPLEISTFLRKVNKPKYRKQWNAIVYKSWIINEKGNSDSLGKVNYLYEDLFNLPDNVAFFLRTYFLRVALKTFNKKDPRNNYLFLKETDLVSWGITELFLKEVINLERQKINELKSLGDRLASYVFDFNEKHFLRNFFIMQNYDYFRALLLKANLKYVKHGKEPLLKLEPYINIFEEGAGLPQNNWRLTRDLVLIRIIEQLHERGWFANNQDLLDQIEEDVENN